MNLYLQGHPAAFIKLTIDESQVSDKAQDDGLIHRFFACAPRSTYYTAEGILDAPEVEYSISLVFFIVYLIHKEKSVVYEMTEDALVFFGEKINYLTSFVSKFNHFEKGDYVR